MASKTAERILFTSLELFNEHGEATVTSVDIAMELDISPGNLYYHFKGKEVIVLALFDMYRHKLSRILATPDPDLSLQDFFCFLYLTLDCSSLFRFLYRNPSDLMEKYPALAKGFRQLLLTREETVGRQLDYLRRNQQLNLPADSLAPLSEQIGLVFSQAANYYLIKEQVLDQKGFIQKCLTSILFLLRPYLKDDDEAVGVLKELIGELRFNWEGRDE
ncbi:TetR/AcrR family transcriptional regulator [Lacimicrobium alkaliphilum]|uniref:TetR family transcriptional regulator n=1 Tax=Lacimicrobium alkaliphilum TaxID=1526571 RepID=A0ABQ1RR88_9ALTE|nr:TetR/AcrR family transcriptional regulator [Lacimicrobium alkaliphilum]GGD76078.1 TetR family transcriptional regulator [Lacimicrobium alkaliphilum]